MNEATILLKNIKPNDYNPNEMTEVEFAELVLEIKHLGKPPKPIVLRNKREFFEIVDGEHSYRALKELGHKELQQGWFEIVDYDDNEAKRQTYKRNLGGTNNPVKLGLMFSQALQESGISNRQLAEQWGISEATIRNYLFYANASKLRNDFANLAKLSREQIKLYVALSGFAQPIADYWLSCGAIEDALIWFSEEKFESLSLFPKAQVTFIEIIKHGADKLLHFKTDFIPFDLSEEEQNKYMQKFKNGIKRAYKMVSLKIRMEKYFDFDENKNEKVAEYLDIYFNNPLALTISPNQIDALFAHIIKRENKKLVFLLTPEELRECMQLEKDEGFYTLIGKIKLKLAKKLNIAPSEIKPAYTWGGIEVHLDDAEIEMRAPDYVKQAKWPIPRKFKTAFLDIKLDDEQKKARWEMLEKKYKLGEFKNIDTDDKNAIKDKMQEILSQTNKREQEIVENEALKQKSETELAELFVNKLEHLFKDDENIKKTLTEKMANTFSKDILYLFVYLAKKYYSEREWQERYKSLLSEARNAIKANK